MKHIYNFVPKLVNDAINGYDSNCLEIGCGSKHYKPYLKCSKYYGLDLPSSKYLVTPPEFAASAESIPAEDGYFDVVFGVATFTCIPDVLSAFKECHRVLRPKGKLLIFDYQKEIIKKLQQSDPCHKNCWNYEDMKNLLCLAGFNHEMVSDKSSAAINVENFIKKKVKSLIGRQSFSDSWLIVEASK